MLLLETLLASFIAYVVAVATIPVVWAAIEVITGQMGMRDTWIFFTRISVTFIMLLTSPALLLFAPIYFLLRATRSLSLVFLASAGAFVGAVLGLLPAVIFSKQDAGIMALFFVGTILTGALSAYVAGLYMRWVDPVFKSTR
jgi:hypothetical protein